MKNESTPQAPADDPEKTPGTPEPEAYSVFPKSIRTWLIFLMGLTMALSTLTATIYFPLIPILTKGFSASIQEINLTVTVYVIFQAVSPALFASLADSYGRRPALLVLTGLYTAGSLGLALNSRSYAALVALRALQSMGGSPTPAIAYGIVADVSDVSDRGAILGPMLAICNGTSVVGPLIGGAVALSPSGLSSECSWPS